MDNWYLVYTKPKNEDQVSLKFIDAGFEVLNPKFKERKVYRRKLQDIVAPLFPCYIFVKFDSSRDYHLVKYSRGVKNIVGPPGKPSSVPDDIITSIAGRMEEGVVILKPQKFKHGEEIIIKSGPFEGFNAIFDKEMKGNERVTILIGAINARTVVDRALIEKSG
jgi:transcriptional antiterminator RfaH